MNFWVCFKTKIQAKFTLFILLLFLFSLFNRERSSHHSSVFLFLPSFILFFLDIDLSKRLGQLSYRIFCILELYDYFLKELLYLLFNISVFPVNLKLSQKAWRASESASQKILSSSDLIMPGSPQYQVVAVLMIFFHYLVQMILPL